MGKQSEPARLLFMRAAAARGAYTLATAQIPGGKSGEGVSFDTQKMGWFLLIASIFYARFQLVSFSPVALKCHSMALKMSKV